MVKNLVCDNANILHNTLGITSVDFDQCFDRGNIPIASIAAQAHGVSLKSTKLVLSTMQLMQYFIKLGFGIADTPSFGGTPESPLMGLGQGSGAAPMGMRCIVTLADLAYKRGLDTVWPPNLPLQPVFSFWPRSFMSMTLIFCTGHPNMAYQMKNSLLTFMLPPWIGE